MSLPHPTESHRTLERFQSGGKEIRLETFALPGVTAAPSVIVLHGATGVEFANRFIANLAQFFAAQHFIVHLLHYFDRTGATYATDAIIKQSSGHWLETVHDAAAHLRRARPDAAIGLFGYSLGGYLAAAELVRNDEIGAAVILAGGIDEASVRAARRAAPALILHGDADTRVPPREARRLESALRTLGGTPELHLYPGEGHLMSMPAYADVVLRGTKFLHAHLEAAKP